MQDKEVHAFIMVMCGAIRWYAREHHENEEHDTSTYFRCPAKRCKQAARIVKQVEEGVAK